MLTRKQHDLLIFIHDYRDSHDGIVPSFTEMQNAMGLNSKSGIARMMQGLEERGFIRRLRHKVRAFEVLKAPQGRMAQGVSAEARFLVTAGETFHMLEHVLVDSIAERLGPEIGRLARARLPYTVSIAVTVTPKPAGSHMPKAEGNHV